MYYQVIKRCSDKDIGKPILLLTWPGADYNYLSQILKIQTKCHLKIEGQKGKQNKKHQYEIEKKQKMFCSPLENVVWRIGGVKDCKIYLHVTKHITMSQLNSWSCL